VQFKLGYEMALTLDTPLPSQGSHYLGMHGYDPALPQMRSTFLVMGAHVPAARNLGEVDMRDIAPTLAALLGTSLPQAQGKPLLPASR
jgi:predicted AlkP superfamily pyrophosphatase or phosphodiesterase